MCSDDSLDVSGTSTNLVEAGGDGEEKYLQDPLESHKKEKPHIGGALGS